MGHFVECVPNFSEGRDKDKIKAIVEAASKIVGVLVLNVESDVDHNRTVLTFIAPVETASAAMFAVIKKSAELIDLNAHKGEHPRMGAADVAPFIPVLDTTIEECIKLAEITGAMVGKELGIPVYLYDLAAKRESRKNLADIRRGQFESLREIIGKDIDYIPDFGPNKIHSTAGAIAIGARRQIVNFNINLDTEDIYLAKKIAKKIRTSSGGLPCLRAKAIVLKSKKQVQISTVITDYKTTSIKNVIDEMNKELAHTNSRIKDTELIGLTTQEALIDFAISVLQVDAFNKNTQVLEKRLLDLLREKIN